MALEPLGNRWRPLINRVFSTLGVTPPGELESELGRLLDLVVTWNAKVDLTAARSAEELVDLFVPDALVIARSGAAAGERWVDVGSGAGAPGIPLALLLPGIDLTLVEPKQKRVAFLRTAAASVGATRVAVQRARSEALPARCSDVALSRATLGPEEWLSEGARLSAGAVWVLLARAEPPALSGWQVDRDESYVWPLTGSPRRALRYVRSV